MSIHEVVELMKTSRSEVEWNANCDHVKRACGGDYPTFWYTAILASGVMDNVRRTW